MRRLLLFLFLITQAAGQSHAGTDPSAPINNIPNRTTISLNGSWHFIVDPYETGLNCPLLQECQAER